MNRTIQYAIHRDDGIVVSRVGDTLAWPILDYEDIGCYLERVPLSDVRQEYSRLLWTRKIPVFIKNQHRAFWGFPLLQEQAQ